MNAATELAALVAAAANRPAGTPFLAVGDDRLDAAGFAAAVRRTARQLLGAGLRPGDRVAVHLHRCVDEAVVLLAAAVAGGIAVPVNPKLKHDQVAHLLRDAEPFCVVVSATKAAALQQPQRTYGDRRLFHAGAAAPRGLPSTPLASLPVPTAPLPAIDPQQPAVLLYTSGSTGLAKGIVQSHHNLALGAALVSGYLRLTASDHLLALLPFSFDYGLNQLLSALHVGCRITAADHLGVGELAQLLLTVAPTGLAGVPSLWHEVARGLASGVLAAAHGQSLRYVTNSGGRLQEADLRALRRHWPHVAVFAMYGLTEAFRSAYLDPAEIDARPDSFGKPLPGVELLLVDPATGQVLDGPATGELVHAGALVAQGYWRNEAATARRFRPDPRGRPGVVVFSGDLVARDAEGFHRFVGRLDRLLKVAGHRVSPDEVAAAVAGQPGVGEVAVLGQDGGAIGHRLVLVASGDPADEELPDRLLRRCRTQLPAYMVPSLVRILPELPHNQNGKVDLPALAAIIGPCTDSP